MRNDGRRQATSPPRDLAAFQRTLGQVLDRYRPALLVVENEENSALFYDGTSEDYAAELKAACQVAHQKGIPRTDGGLVSTLVALVVYDHYRESGQEAQDFAPRSSPPRSGDSRILPNLRSNLAKALLAPYRLPAQTTYTATGMSLIPKRWGRQ